MLQDCKTGDRFAGTVLVSEWREVAFRQKPGTYLLLTCQDRTGSLPGKVWDVDVQYLAWLQAYDVYQVEGMVTEFRGANELTIERFYPLDNDKIDITQLLASSPVAEAVLEERLQALLGKVRQPELQELVKRIFADPVIGDAFRKAPAAVKVHQPYLRGLWEHSLGVAEIAEGIAGRYPEVNLGLLITGALLHDIGKIFEYSYDRAIKVTTEGRLLGHIIMGTDLLSREMEKISGFPVELKWQLLHIVTSHHGRYEWQSPKRPKMMEALIIHYADAMEADLWQFHYAKEANPEAEWSSYMPSLERYIYLGK